MEVWERGKRRLGARKALVRPLSDHDGESDGMTLHGVRKRMREPGIRGTCPNASKKTAKQARDADERPDPLERDLASPVPTCRPVADMTYLRTLGGLICLATVIGLATRMAVGWAISNRMAAALAMRAMDMAWSRGHVAGNAIFHSDYAEENARAQIPLKPQVGDPCALGMAA